MRARRPYSRPALRTDRPPQSARRTVKLYSSFRTTPYGAGAAAPLHLRQRQRRCSDAAGVLGPARTSWPGCRQSSASDAAGDAAAEPRLQYHSNKFFAWGSGPGDDGSVALEQRLQGGPASPALPGGAAPGLHSRHPRVLPETRSKKGFPSVFKIRDDSFELIWKRLEQRLRRGG